MPLRHAIVRLPLLLGVALLATFCRGREQPMGVIEGERRPEASLERAAEAQLAAVRSVGAPASAASAKRILFGDLHVHTTYSIDAFMYSLPIFAGEGVHPPADACDFARYCSALDFFSLNDHAEGLTPEQWEKTKQSLRQCNERAGDPANPDLVAFVGFEWTQAGRSRETHFGHKNVIFPGLDDAELPARPITALSDDVLGRARHMWLVRSLQTLRPLGFEPYADFLRWVERLAEVPNCESGVDTRALPTHCRENADTPEVLFEKLAQWGFDSLVIPHGLTWGIHAPPDADLQVQLGAARRAPERQRLLEVYSGHGSAERYRASADFPRSSDPVCPEPTAKFLPCCWRAGEIIRERCGALPKAECDARVEEARRLALAAGRRPLRVIPDARVEDWLDCDQCRDCFKPAMTPRPRQSAQYGLALADFDEPDASGRPGRFRFGLIGSSDDHGARPGTGYKQVHRKVMSDARGLRSERLRDGLRPWIQGEQQDSQRAQPAPPTPMGFRNLMDVERGASFLYPGGLVAVHAAGRDRTSIWRSLQRREVYGTSGPRVLLWFELLNAPGGPVPMGAEVAMQQAPSFEVRAVGSQVQQPGCPPESAALSSERLERLCRGQCYNTGDERHAIRAIEVIRIRPRRRPDEPVAGLIEDPWLRFECPREQRGCSVRFEDPEFETARRDVLYYVRALQEETPAINAANLRTSFDADGKALRVDPCYGDERTPVGDDCLAPVQERAWSSPIFVDWRAR